MPAFTEEEAKAKLAVEANNSGNKTPSTPSKPSKPALGKPIPSPAAKGDKAGVPGKAANAKAGKGGAMDGKNLVRMRPKCR